MIHLLLIIKYENNDQRTKCIIFTPKVVLKLFILALFSLTK